MTLEEVFAKFIRNEGDDRAEVGTFLSRPENRHLMSSAEFLDLAVKNTSAFYTPTEAVDEDEDDGEATPSRREVRDAIVDALTAMGCSEDGRVPFATTTRSDRPNEFTLLSGGVTFRIVVEQL